MDKYYLYILRCSDQTLYTGITKDLQRRVKEHNFSSLGARYTRGRRPVKLIYSKKFTNRSAASQEEFRVKKLSRKQKVAIIKKSVNLYKKTRIYYNKIKNKDWLPNLPGSVKH